MCTLAVAEAEAQAPTGGQWGPPALLSAGESQLTGFAVSATGASPAPSCRRARTEGVPLVISADTVDVSSIG